MPDQPPHQADRRHPPQQTLLEAIQDMRQELKVLRADVAGLLKWRIEQDEEDRIRRDREQKERWFAEWSADRAAEHRAKIERMRKISKAVGGLLAAADAAGIWEVISTSEHGFHWSVAAVGTFLLAVVSIICLIL